MLAKPETHGSGGRRGGFGYGSHDSAGSGGWGKLSVPDRSGLPIQADICNPVNLGSWNRVRPAGNPEAQGIRGGHLRDMTSSRFDEGVSRSLSSASTRE